MAPGNGKTVACGRASRTVAGETDGSAATSDRCGPERETLVRRMRMPVTQPGQWSSGGGFPLIPFAVGKAARDVADLTGRWLRAGGVNIDFAPVADVNVRQVIQ